MVRVVFIAMLVMLTFGRVQKAEASNLYSSFSGNWTNPSTWTYNSDGSGSCGCTPLGGDLITILSGNTISVSTNVNIATDVKLEIYGTIYITGFLQLDGPGTVVNIYTDAQLTSNGSSSNKLRIGGTGTAEYVGTMGNISGPWTISNGYSGPNTALPVKLGNFTAHHNANDVVLEWETFEEVNSNYFMIEKSADGHVFEVAGTVKSYGTTLAKHQYNFTDPLQYTDAYYRLKQVDLNGQYYYSEIIFVKGNNISFDLSIYPVPVSFDNLNIVLLGAEHKQVVVVILDGYGNELLTKVIMEEDVHVITSGDMPAVLTSGIYIVKASVDQEMVSQKLIVQ